MSDPHSPRPLVAYPDAVRTALGLMRSAVLSGESWSVELAAAYEDAVAALPAAEPAESAEARQVLANALARVGIVSENLGSMGNADQYDYDWPTTDGLLRELASTGWVIRSAGTPPASRVVDDRRAAPIIMSEDDFSSPATPPEPVGGREALRLAATAFMEHVQAQGCDHADSKAGSHTSCPAALTIRAALQASPPTGVSDDQCPERCLGIVGHAGSHQTSDYEPRADVPGWMLSDIKARDAQTEPTPVRALPLGESGTKYDHARRQTSTYHLDSPDVAMGDRHVLLHGWTGPRPVDPQPAMGVPDAREQADSEDGGYVLKGPIVSADDAEPSR